MGQLKHNDHAFFFQQHNVMCHDISKSIRTCRKEGKLLYIECAILSTTFIA